MTQARKYPPPRRHFFGALLELPVQRGRIIWIAVIGMVVILTSGLLIRSSEFDIAIVRALNTHHHGPTGAVTNAVYELFGPSPAIIGTVIVTGLIAAITRNLRIASTFAFTIAATWAPLALVKIIVNRARPDAAMLPFPFNPAQVDASYPSGHTAFVTAVVVTALLGLSNRRVRWIAATFGGLVVVGVGISLLIDGVHFPSDVIASILWSILVAPAARLVWVSGILRRIGAARPTPHARSSREP